MSSKSVEEQPMFTRRLLPWTIAASLLLHGVAYAALEAEPVSSKPPPRKTQLRFDVVQKPPPAPAATEARPEPPRPKLQKAAKPQAEPPKPLPAEPAPPPATVSDGLTLAADGSGPGFAMPLGGGGALEPTRARSPAPLDVPAPVTPAPVKAEPVLVAVGDLSARPSPPALGPALERNYPPDARRRGLSGTAKVRARIDPDGVVRRVSLLEESAAGFGSSCSRTLTGSRWAPPKDKAGRAVATEIRYTCRFVVE